LRLNFNDRIRDMQLMCILKAAILQLLQSNLPDFLIVIRFVKIHCSVVSGQISCRRCTTGCFKQFQVCIQCDRIYTKLSFFGFEIFCVLLKIE